MVSLQCWNSLWNLSCFVGITWDLLESGSRIGFGLHIKPACPKYSTQTFAIGKSFLCTWFTCWTCRCSFDFHGAAPAEQTRKPDGSIKPQLQEANLISAPRILPRIQMIQIVRTKQNTLLRTSRCVTVQVAWWLDDLCSKNQCQPEPTHPPDWYWKWVF